MFDYAMDDRLQKMKFNLVISNKYEEPENKEKPST